MGSRNSQEFYGTSLMSRDFGQFVMTERQYPGGCETPVHAHARPLFCIVLEGAYQEQHRNTTLNCARATTLFHAARENHLERFAESGARSLIVEFEQAWIDHVREISPAVIDNTLVQHGGILGPIGAKLYREFLSGDAASRLVIEGLLMEIAGEFFRVEHACQARPPRWLATATEIIQANFALPMTLACIANQVAVHPVHLAQSFRRFHGCTIGDYVRRTRIDYACQQLVRSDISLIELANSAGFADQSHFSRVFKRVVGVSPSQYRSKTR